ncbi:hypothetical protein [uncultured Eudoraea sp.]|uniref:hypothetical protein n=1 Tax=uncultured Eudoraea sp. TaxID=1035614 RepID=UPI00262A8F82|nr:hypothetical protein [uncultured Eudoraea sp.]
MKRLKIAILAIGVFGFAACGSDDNDEGVDNCQTCSLSILDQEVVSEYCDNGDGTVTVTTAGVEQTEDLDGATFDQFITALELIGTCN